MEIVVSSNETRTGWKEKFVVSVSVVVDKFLNNF